MPVSSYSLPLVAFTALTIGLYGWGVWVCRRQASPVFRMAARGVLLGAALALAGAFLAMQRLAAADGAAQAADPEAANRLADGIAGAFALAALPVGLGQLILLASVVVLIVGTVRPPTPRASDTR